MVNNVCYNWCGRTTDGGVNELDFINNYYKPGAASKIFRALHVDHEAVGLGMQRAYFAGNVMPGYFDENSQDKGRVSNVFSGATVNYETFMTKAFYPTYVTTQSAGNAFKVVLSDVGANQPFQTDREIRIINETKTGTYKYTGSKSGKPGLPDREGDVGGFDNFTTTNRASDWDSDNDGLPNIWEKILGTSNSSSDFSDANADPDKDGYTNLEDYINWLADPHYFLNEGGSQTIDLTTTFRGFGSPTYSVSDVVGGKVAISGSKATFTPSGCGFGSFVLKATESGFTMPRKVGVLTSGNGTCITTDLMSSEEIIEQGNVLAFPNPFGDHFNIRFKGAFSYQVVGVEGSEIVSGHGVDSKEIGQELRPGVYMLKIQSEGKSQTIKIVKASR